MGAAVVEAGRKVSAANQSTIKAAIRELLKLLDDSSDGAKVAEAKTSGSGTIQTLDEIKAGLQKLIDLLSPEAKENLEGDGDGDNDADNVILQGRVGEVCESLKVEGGVLRLQETLHTLLEKQYTAAQRKAFAAKGWAIPVKNDKGEITNGRYPIADKEDLDDAKHRIGTGNKADKAEIIAHINKRAADLGEPKVGESDDDDDDKAKKKKAKESASGPALASQFIRELFATSDDPSSADIERVYAKYANPLKEAAKSKGGMICASCKAPVENTWDSFCSNCGNALRGSKKSGYCPGCGDSMDSSDKYCGSCGTPAATLSESALAPLAENGGLDINEQYIPLLERAVGRDGSARIKLIQPGWGSSGYYSASVLEKAGPKAFPAGTKMFWNHPTASEEAERPERDLRDLAAVFLTDAVYQEAGPAGPGLYAVIKPVSQYKESIEELAPHIGVSIRADGVGRTGEAEGKKGVLVEDITVGRSTDFVTEPGAGGQILQLFESARSRPAPVAVQPNKDDDVTEQDLIEAKKKITTLELENARLRERTLLREAHDFACAILDKVEGLPVPTLARLRETIALNPPVDDDKELDQKAFRAHIKEAVKKELAYVESLTRRGAVSGMGNNPFDNDDDGDTSLGLNESRRSGNRGRMNTLEADFGRLGLSEAISKQAAAGRR